MKIEHFALNVPDPLAMAAWYCQHLGMQVRFDQKDGSLTHFLADSSGQVMLEIYRNEAAPVPDYPAQHSLVLHLAFACARPAETAGRLLAAGAQWDSEYRHPDGTHLVMLRDPWGLAIQLCHRARPLLEPGS